MPRNCATGWRVQGGTGWNRVLDFILQYLVWQTSIIYMQVDMNGIDRMPRRSSCLLVCNET